MKRAKINLNGDKRETLVERMEEALFHMDRARAAVSLLRPHGRNYQHEKMLGPDWQADRDEIDNYINKLDGIRNSLLEHYRTFNLNNPPRTHL